MGVNQSSNGAGSSGPGGGVGQSGENLKTCYYELLDVDRQASEDEIKKAYRKKALELHPDRNYGDVEETTKRFAAVQSAYEILSDPQERAWYDTHRDTILRNEGDSSADNYEHNVRITTAENIMRMFTRFHGKMDYSDAATGFYSALREVFNTLASEESLACEWEGLEPIAYPSFGSANDEYEDTVRPFYAEWSGFATKKTFSWEDVYRYSEAPDRRVRRMMEKENKSFREDGIRDFNDAVRSLVAFVKKRDPRFKSNVQSEAERQKVLKNAAVAQAARSRAANQLKFAKPDAVPAWAHSVEVQEEEISDGAEEAVQEQVECVVCKKSFKSEKQYEAHEKSRKHVRAVQHLRRQMQQENNILDLDKSGDHTDVQRSSPPLDNVEVEETPHTNGGSDGEFNVTGAVINGDNDPSLNVQGSSSDGPDAEHGTVHDEATSPAPSMGPSASSSDDEYTSRENIEARILSRTDGTQAHSSGPQTSQPDVTDITEKLASGIDIAENCSKPQSKVGKAKEKRAKKAAQKSTLPTGSEAEFKCVTCQAGFPSKTQLFNHIKDFGHAQPVPRPAKSGKGKKK